MKAYLIEANNKVGRGRWTDFDQDALDPGSVTIQTAYAGVNYKDALAGLGAGPIVRRYPCIGGIECAGKVLESDDPSLPVGAPVIVHGRGIGVNHHGGFAELVRVPAGWVRPLPDAISPLEAATIGVAGYSAALAVDRLETLGLVPGALPVVVSGATGGVGRFAVAMLAKRGHGVVAVTSKAASAKSLEALGPVAVISPEDLGDGALEAGRFAGGIDTVGGVILPKMLAAIAPGGVVAALGNAGGVSLETTVFPFILRGITLTGINADSDDETRAHIWSRLTGDLRPHALAGMANLIGPDDLVPTLQALLDGQAPSRSVLDLTGSGLAQ